MRVRPALLVLAAVAALLPAVAALLPAAAQGASPACRALPVHVALGSSDPTALRDDPQAVVRPRGGARVGDVRVTLTRDGRLYASGSLTGRLADGRTAIALRLMPGRRIGAGRYRLSATGLRSGCHARTSAARTWRFGTPSLPVRAAPISTLVSDNAGGVRLLLRSVDRQPVSGVRVTLLDAGGATVAQAVHAASFSGQVSVELPLARALPAGDYTLRVSGQSAGRSSVSEQRLAFAAGSSGGGTTTESATTGMVDQQAVVDWSGGAYQGRDVAGFVAPGIGYGEIVCRPDAQWIRFYPNDLGREVSMMNWTYRDWTQHQEKAIREALHTATTGKDFREGFNKFWPPEKRSTGQFDGIITDRGAFGDPVPGSLAAPTTLRLTWTWDFSSAGAESCHVEARFVSQSLANALAPLARSASIAWRGSDAAAGHDTTSVEVPGLGTVTLTCQAAIAGTRTLTVDTEQGATVTRREGSDDSSRAQALGPVSADLPNNGMVSIALPGGATLLASSRWKVNDPDGSQNSCFVAAQAIIPP